MFFNSFINFLPSAAAERKGERSLRDTAEDSIAASVTDSKSFTI